MMLSERFHFRRYFDYSPMPDTPASFSDIFAAFSPILYFQFDFLLHFSSQLSRSS